MRDPPYSRPVAATYPEPPEISFLSFIFILSFSNIIMLSFFHSKFCLASFCSTSYWFKDVFRGTVARCWPLRMTQIYYFAAAFPFLLLHYQYCIIFIWFFEIIWLVYQNIFSVLYFAAFCYSQVRHYYRVIQLKFK